MDLVLGEINGKYCSLDVDDVCLQWNGMEWMDELPVCISTSPPSFIKRQKQAVLQGTVHGVE